MNQNNWTKVKWTWKVIIKMFESKFIKEEKDQNPWLSPIITEREWQEKHLTKIFEHYPHASPKWQYMNGLIRIACEHLNIEIEEPKKLPKK